MYGSKKRKIVIITIIMLLLQKVLAAHGATKVSAYVTHAVFPKNSWKKFVHKNGGKPLSLTLFVSFYFTLLMQCFRRTLGTFLVTRRICIFKGTRLFLNCVSTVSQFM
ncbi:putative ribose-phosphate diphosphokinase [Helianthus annuus]|nr:putative ribose-phosphate diphosphokinase [Helianthus annuus]